MDKYSASGLSARYEKLNQKQDLLVRLNSSDSVGNVSSAVESNP